MFSFRRKPKAEEPAPIRTSPSLPELSAQGIPWPADLVDLSALPPPLAQGNSVDSSTANGVSISSLYMSHPPSAFDRKQSYPRVRPAQKRSRNPTTFNIMIAGAQHSGKTSLLRLLLETAEISPTATPEQRVALRRFLHGPPKRTDAIQTACVEICESKYDRLLLSVIDTPGLDFLPGHELKLERQVTGIVKYMDTQYADTMNEESKVVRQSKGDQHIHLCIYTIDPASIMTAAARQALTSPPSHTRSETTLSHPSAAPAVAPAGAETPSSPVPAASLPPHDDDDEQQPESDSEADSDDSLRELTMSPADIRVIRRLSLRANVLPVVARADSLTNEKLAAIKRVIRRDLHAAGLDFGVFGPAKAKGDDTVGTREKEKKRKEEEEKEEGAVIGSPTDARNRTTAQGPEVNGNGHGNGLGPAPLSPADASHASLGKDAQEDVEHAAEEVEQEQEQEEEERRPRPVIKLRPARVAAQKTRLSRSRSRRELSESANEPSTEDVLLDAESVASVRFSAQAVVKTDLSDVLPFALIAPEHTGRRKPAKTQAQAQGVSAAAAAALDDRRSVHTDAGAGASLVGPSEDGHVPPTPTTSRSARPLSYLSGPPADLRGVFVRSFRWGTIDVLSPEHCDFAALRTTVLSTHMKMLKVRTKEVLYERFRTEKLLAKRATRNISEGETRKLFEELGL